MKLSFGLALLLGLAGCAGRQSEPVSSAALTSFVEEKPLPETPEAEWHPAPKVALEAWPSRFPDAARLLGSWVKAHHATANALAQWEQTQPAKMKVLIDWSVTDVDDPIGSFLMTRWGWDDLRAIAEKDPAGVNALLSWIRSAPTAAMQLQWQSRALTFATQNADSLTKMSPERELAAHPEPLVWTTGPGWEPTNQ